MRDSSGTHRPFAVTVEPGTADRTHEGEVTISAEGHPEWTARVPVDLRAEELIITPREVFFGLVKPGEKKEQTITTRSRSGKPFAITECQATGSGVQVGEAVRVGEAEWTIGVSLQGAGPGTVRGTVIAQTDLAGRKPISVPVYGQVVE
jgi:hypothetical protein